LQLDATGRRLGDPRGETRQALSVVEEEASLGHSRMTIQLQQRKGKRFRVKQADPLRCARASARQAHASLVRSHTFSAMADAGVSRRA